METQLQKIDLCPSTKIVSAPRRVETQSGFYLTFPLFSQKAKKGQRSTTQKSLEIRQTKLLVLVTQTDQTSDDSEVPRSAHSPLRGAGCCGFSSAPLFA